jgi:hypothetical protein
MSTHDRTQAVHSPLSLVYRHFKRFKQRLTYCGHVVWIDDERVTVKLLHGSREFTENQNAVAIDIAGTVLLRDQIHPVSYGCDEGDLGGAIITEQLLTCQMPVNVVYRDPSCYGEFSVDAADKLLDFCFESFIAGDVRTTRNHNLNERDALMDLRMGAQKMVKSFKSIRNPLGIIETVNAEDNLSVLYRLMNVPGRFRNLLTSGLLFEVTKINADGKYSEPDVGTLCRTDVHPALVTYCNILHQHADALDKIAVITHGLKADKIILQQRMQQLEAPGQLDEDVWRRKWYVQKKSDRCLYASPAQLLPNMDEMIVMHPHVIANPVLFGYHRCEFAVHSQVAVPVFRSKAAQRLQIVE